MRPARDRRGTAAVEFALIAPALILLLAGTVDTVNALRAKHRIEGTAVQIGQVISQCNQITTPGDTSQFWGEAQRLLAGLADVLGTSGGAVVVSAVYNSNSTNKLAWQIRTGNAAYASTIGTAAGATATLPAGYLVPASQTLIVTEVFAPVKARVLSTAVLGALSADKVGATTLFVSRALDPIRLQQAPTANNTAGCTA